MWGHMSTTDLPGSSLLANRYRLVERLGAGGMSVVWRGFDEVLGRQVAVKVLPPSTSADPSFRRRLRAEAQAAARLGHPNITNVYDYGEAITIDGEPVPYVVMELVDGESLAAVLARVRRLPWPAAVRICAEVSAALAAAHARGIVHRDVTPANVMLTPTGAKVVDFGISALIGENDIDPDGSLLGTPAYLAPERLEGGQVSPATDVYAVGLLIYRTLIGQLPWDVGTTTALLRAHQYTEPDPLPPVEGLPTAVSALVEQCLEKRPDDRPSSAEVAQVLAGVSAGTPASRGYVPDWAESGEDTTILPSGMPDTDRIGRIRRGHARVADSTPVQSGRGVASVRAAAEGPAGLAAAAAMAAAAAENAPISPAPGTAMPVPVSDVQAAVAGEPVTDRPMVAAAVSPAVPTSPAAAASASSGTAPAGPAVSPPGSRSPGEGPGRNNRFSATPRPVGSAAAAAGPAASASAVAAPIAAARAVSAPVSPSAASAPVASARAVSAPVSAPAASGPAASGPGSSASATSAPSAVPAQGPATSLRPASAAPPPGGGGGGSGGSGGNPSNGSGSGGGTGRWQNTNPQTRRVLVGAATVLLLGAAAYGWSLTATSGDQTKQTGVVSPQPTVLAATGKCVVSYAVLADDNGRFDASVTVANRDSKAIKNWNLWFIMQGDQVVKGVDKVDLDQQGRTVTVRSDTVLSPQKSVTMQVSGRYTKSNAAPMVFQLGGQSCETYVSTKPGQRSRPVQRLSNGQVRLGPPTTKPTPGISLDPHGVVVPVPVPTTKASTTTKPTSPSPTPTVTVPLCEANPELPECGPAPGPSSRTPSATQSDTPPPTETASSQDPADTGSDTDVVGTDGGPPPALGGV